MRIFSGLKVMGLTLLMVYSSGVASAEENEWNYHAELYLLGADLNITTDSGLDTTVEFDDILDNLDFGLFGSFEAKRDKFSILANLMYVDVSASENREGELADARVTVDVETMVTSLAAGWQFHGSDTSSFQGIAGVRWLQLDSDFSLVIDPIIDYRDNSSDDMVDFIVGFQGHASLSEHWYLDYYADIGTGDSDMTWQASAAIAYRFNDSFDMALGYQWVDWQFDDQLVEDLQIAGPALGVRFHW